MIDPRWGVLKDCRGCGGLDREMADGEIASPGAAGEGIPGGPGEDPGETSG